MEDSNDRLTLKNTETLDHPYSLCGRRCYVIGFQNGLFPDIGWHKTKEMGGVWTHPIKIADGFWLSVDSAEWPPPASYNPIRREWFKECDEFVLGDGGAWSEHIYHKFGWEVTRRQFVPRDEAALGVEVRIKSESPSRVRLTVLVRFDILSAWQSAWPDPIHLETEAQDGGVVVHGVSGYDIPYEHGFWAAALLSDPKPDRLAIGESLWGPERTQSNSGTSVLMTFLVTPDPEAKVRFVLAGDIEGEKAATGAATRVLTEFDASLQEKIAWYRHIANEMTVAETPEKLLNDACLWSKLNLEWMTQHSPPVGTCVVAGHQDFTSYFGCDTFLSIRGILAAGLIETAKETLRVIGAQAAKNHGKAPHEFSTTGYVHDPGSVGETTLFIRSVWDTYLWSGDEEFLKEMYPVCRQGIWEYIPSEPIEDGVLLAEIEDRPGGARDKCMPVSLVMGYQVFARMAERMGDTEDAEKARAEAELYLRQTEDLFWVEERGCYADRLDAQNRPVISDDEFWGRPFEGVAYHAVCRKDRVIRNLEQFEGPQHASEYGVYLSSGRNCNMPLQTCCAAISEFNYGRIEQGLRFLRMLAKTMGHAMPGAFPEALDPDGDLKKFRHFRSAHWNYLQLWSAAPMAEGLVWGLLHLEPDAARKTATITPRLPKGWPYAEIRNIRIGQSRINVRLDETGVKVTHVDGPELEIKLKEYEE